MAARTRSPAADKALTYAHERRGFAEYPHAYRGKRRKKKAALESAFRARVRDELRRALGAPGEADLDKLAVEAIVREPIRSWGSTSLGEWVESSLASRISSTARNFFKAPYDTDQHRTRFVAFLASLVEGRSDGARAIARRFGALLSPPTWPVAPETDAHAAERDRAWLAAFFVDEPAWYEKLAAWTREAAPDEPDPGG